MIAFLIFPFIIALFYFLIHIEYKYLNRFHNKYLKLIIIFIACFLYGGLLISAISFFVIGDLKRILVRISYIWLGILLYLIIGSIILNTIYFFIHNHIQSKKIKKLVKGCFVVANIVFCLLMNIFGYLNAHNIEITKYNLTINKKANVNSFRIALISDIHIGYNSSIEDIKNIVNKVNSINPDIVLIAGDIFDNEYNAIGDSTSISKILSNMNSKYGSYTILGNHDVEEKIFLGFTFGWITKQKASISEDMLDFLKESNINILYDDYITIDGINIYGRPDKNNINFGNEQRLSTKDITNKFNNNEPLIILDHQPSDLNNFSNKNVDLILSGHTHNGQFWPGTISINFIWDNAYGYKKYNDMHSIVSSGAGVFGLNLKTGCISEICDITLNFD